MVRISTTANVGRKGMKMKDNRRLKILIMAGLSIIVGISIIFLTKESDYTPTAIDIPATSNTTIPAITWIIAPLDADQEAAQKALESELEATRATLEVMEGEVAALVLSIDMITSERNQLLAKVTELSALDYPALRNQYITLLKKYDAQYLELTKFNELRAKYDALVVEHDELVRLYAKCEE